VLLLRTSSEINSKHGELFGNLMGTHGEPKKRKKIMLMRSTMIFITCVVKQVRPT
jgi:hypothetical protein